MKSAIVMGLLLLAGYFGTAQAQSPQTKITRIEVDQKEVRANYKVLFLLNGNWIEAENTRNGFIVPPEFRGQEKLTIRFIFGDHDLEFTELHHSLFETDWVIGVDLAPYSEEYVKPEEADGVLRAYYIVFQNRTGLGTVHVVTTRSAAATIKGKLALITFV